MRRIGDSERGAVAVIVAVLATALIGFTALGVDVANMHADKQQLQNGADAGALAIAHHCAKGGAGCVSNNAALKADALTLAKQNKKDSQARVDSVVFNGGDVTVTVADETEHWFARVFGTDQSTVAADATATYGAYGGGTTIPLGIYMGYIQCLAESGSTFTKNASGGYEFVGSTPPKNVAIYLEKFDGKKTTGCSIGKNWIPGGFGWLEVLNGTCSAATTYDGVYNDEGDNGAAPPNGCKKGSMDALVGKTIAMPVFENPPIGQGSNGTYSIAGYIAFHVRGFDFPAAGKAGTTSCKDKCIYGYFDTLANMSGIYDPAAPNWGNTVVTLKD